MARTKAGSLAERVPPQNLEAEKALIACVLIDEDARNRALETVRPDFFYSPAHRSIFTSVLKLFERNEKCDLVTLANQLKQEGTLEEVGGPNYLGDLADSIATAAHVDEYAKIIKDKYVLRSLIANATKIIADASGDPEEVEPLLDRAESLIFEVSEHRIEREAYAMKDLVHGMLEHLEMLHSRPDLVTGLPTGFRDLDQLTNGLQPSDLVIIASRPSMGKTAFACNIALNLAGSKTPILIFSLEMSKEQLVQRMLCAEAKIDLLKLRSGVLSDRGMGDLMQAAGRLAEAPIFVDDSAALNVFEVRARARRLKAREGIQLVVVDYLQLMRGRGRTENRQQEISEISGSLKALAKELAVPVIAISQLSRATEQREDKIPQLSDLRESGSIEQDADLVMLLFRGDYYNTEDPEQQGRAQIIVAKQRNGPTGNVDLTFLKQYTRFENFSRRLGG